jgi:predicted nucleic-acid-binding Zn-ribbon protein
MPLNDKQAQKLTEWMESKAINPNCASCGQNNWVPNNIVFAPTVVQGTVQYGAGLRDPETGGPQAEGAPMVQIICGNCAYTMLYAAGPIGLA